MSDYTDDVLSEAREWLAGPKTIRDPQTTELVERLQNELRRRDNAAQAIGNPIEAQSDKGLADAWDEGCRIGRLWHDPQLTDASNPYR